MQGIFGNRARGRQANATNSGPTQEAWDSIAQRLHGNTHLCKPRFVPAENPRQWHCVFHPLPGGAKVTSAARTTKAEALDDAIEQLRRLGLCRTRTANRGLPLPVSVAPARSFAPNVKEQQRTETTLAPETLRDAAAAWRIEHEYLLRLRARSSEQDTRLHRLSLFCAASDPLRKHELDRTGLRKLLTDMALEVSIYLDRQTERWQYRAAAEALRALTGVAFSEAGIRAARNPKYEALCGAWGISGETQLKALIDRRMLRRSPSGELTLSPIGATCMERALTDKAGPMSVQARVSTTALAQLLQLKLDVGHHGS